MVIQKRQKLVEGAGAKNCVGDVVLRRDAGWSILIVLKRSIVSVIYCRITNQPQIE